MDILKPFNLSLTIVSILLLSIGILVIFSSSKELALQQLIFAILGLGVYYLISQLDFRNIKRLIKPLYILVNVLLLVVLIMGVETRGSIRWIGLGGFNIQPSELAKPIIVLLLAEFWSHHLPTWSNIFKSLGWIGLPLALIFKQPDLGTTLTIFAIWVGIVFAAGISYKKILAIILIIALSLPLVWFSLHDYQKQRFLGFLSPENDPLGVGYNIIQSTIAVGSGQALGKGLGSGTQSRLQFLPEFRTDFIFASITEELGFLGSILIISLYLSLIWFSLKVSEISGDLFGFLIVAGVVSGIAFQSVVNIGMNIGIFPVTGITLPLISYGGSSLFSILICLGLVSSVGRFPHTIDTKLD